MALSPAAIPASSGICSLSSFIRGSINLFRAHGAHHGFTAITATLYIRVMVFYRPLYKKTSPRLNRRGPSIIIRSFRYQAAIFPCLTLLPLG